MKILVYAPYAINTPHFETELEIIQNHLDRGDDICFLGCNADLLACDVNPYHNVKTCLKCIGRRKAGLKLLSSKIKVMPLYLLTDPDKGRLRNCKIAFSGLEELEEYEVDGFDVGYGVLSSLVSGTRDPEVDLIKYQDLLKRYMLSSFAVYLSMRNYLSTYSFDRTYVYNGRYAIMRPAWRACQSMNVECLLHERGSRISRYTIFRNVLPHDVEAMDRAIKETWLSAQNNPDRDRIAAQFFLDRYNDVSHTWIAYTEKQQRGRLPEDWDENKINVSIFLSSEDEFVAIGKQWKNPIYGSQIEGIIKILDSTRDNNRLHFYLRVHPNLADVRNEQVAQIEHLKSPNLTVIPADSPISTYTLLKKSSKVITFGSTVGIEAVYWGVPSILAGQSFYRNLGATYNANSHEELIAMLDSDLRPKSKEGALMYGYYFDTFGNEFVHYKATGIYDGFFKGKVVREGLLFRFLISALTNTHFYRIKPIADRLFSQIKSKRIGYTAD